MNGSEGNETWKELRAEKGQEKKMSENHSNLPTQPSIREMVCVRLAAGYEIVGTSCWWLIPRLTISMQSLDLLII